MARKKTTKKKSVRKSSVSKKRALKISKVVPTEKKEKQATRELIFFSVLALITYVLYAVSNNEVYVNLFWILSVIFFFIAIAFLIVFLILFFLKGMKKK